MRPIALAMLSTSVGTSGCPKAPDAAADAAAREPKPIVAGPRRVLEHPEEAAAVRPGAPGVGPEIPYLVAIRRSFMPAYRICVEGLDLGRATEEVPPTLLRASIGPTGALLGLSLDRSSGQDVLDDCAVNAVRGADLPPPPEAIRDADGRYDTPDLAFAPRG